MTDQRKPSIGALEVVLSLLLPGLGHVIRGWWAKGLLMMGLVGVLGGTGALAIVRNRLAWIAGPSDYWFSTTMLLLFMALLWIFAIFDLFRSHKSENEPELVRGYWSMAIRRFSRDPKGIIGLSIIMFMIHIAIFAPFFAEGNGLSMGKTIEDLRAAPSAAHPLGTDNFGRDILDRLIFGARVALGIGGLATMINMLLGGFLGLLGGYFRGVTDSLIMRVLEIINSIPFLVLVLLVLSMWRDGGILTLVLVLGIFGLQPARIIRSEVLSVREKDYILSARAIGVPVWRIIFAYVLPNAIASLLVVTTMSIGVNIIVVAGLSFLGFGVTPPTPSWGAMLQTAQEYMRVAPWMAIYPGIAIIVTVFGFNIFGDSLRDVLDPRLR